MPVVALLSTGTEEDTGLDSTALLVAGTEEVSHSPFAQAAELVSTGAELVLTGLEGVALAEQSSSP